MTSSERIDIVRVLQSNCVYRIISILDSYMGFPCLPSTLGQSILLIGGMKNWKLVILVLVELTINFVVFVKLNRVYPLSYLLDPSLYCSIVLFL